jgi:hypothetical protein
MSDEKVLHLDIARDIAPAAQRIIAAMQDRVTTIGLHSATAAPSMSRP